VEARSTSPLDNNQSPPPAAPHPTEDELYLDREIEYAFEAEEAMGVRPPVDVE
jgi:hypothetical protein